MTNKKLLIFFMSSQKAEQSNQLSYGIIDVIVNALNRWFPNVLIDLQGLNGIIRTCAHFFEYFILSLLVVNALSKSFSFRIRRVFCYAVVFCLLYALTDEFHQMVVSGRSAQLIDVVIDFAGSFFGAGLITVIVYFKRSRKNVDFILKEL